MWVTDLALIDKDVGQAALLPTAVLTPILPVPSRGLAGHEALRSECSLVKGRLGRKQERQAFERVEGSEEWGDHFKSDLQ